MEAIDLWKKIQQGDRFALSKAITLIESEESQKKQEANQLLHKCLPHQGKAIRLGITGSPGAGKSTFINALTSHLLPNNLKIAILAIDPSSSFSKGSILGDKTRMADIIHADHVFIRPSPSKGSLGGITESTYKTCMLLDAAGYNYILIETVGVGQSEIFIQKLVDLVVLLTIPGAGDELQGIKKGILEIADVVILNKVENPNDKTIKQSLAQLKSAFSVYHHPPQIVTCSALEKMGIAEIWITIQEQLVSQKSIHLERRSEQKKELLKHILIEKWKDLLSAKLNDNDLRSIPADQTLDDYADQILKKILISLPIPDGSK